MPYNLICKIFLILAINANCQEISNPGLNFKKCDNLKELKNFLGETLEYDIYWSFINVGKAYIKVEDIVEISSNTCAYKIISRANSSSFLENIYKVNDYNEAWFDINLNRSYGYYKDISEGKHKKKEWVIYDYKKKKYYGETLKKKDKGYFEGEIESNLFDILSALFYFRIKENKKNDIYSLKVNTKKTWDLNILNHGEEKIEINNVKYRCTVFEPMVGDEGIFVPQKGKKLLVYISDKEKIPVMLKAEVFIGSVVAKLSKIQTPKNNY
jgi:hypothetical protein